MIVSRRSAAWIRRVREFPARGFIKFCLVGSSGVVVDLSVYRLLLHFHLPNPGARAAAILVAMTCNFLLNRNWTFRDSGDRSAWAQFPRYVFSSALGAVVSWSVSMALSHGVRFFHSHLMPAALAGIAAGTLTNFLLASKWVFARPRE
jgi:dolichol-phosphate mannosyltransferase